ncbi:hypothetical protein M2325_000664 [Methanococcus voltae PS]|uniref:Uncharacterized protein n=1 Tax=Methanococcus voltae PS TaxID=523842 RepID=A0ABT2EVJ1_METVO|nr:hypothetical protein [Methanococcus voltae]MCS3921979.1 hypothetical protein [Methanococcus voltae PS]
MTGQVKEQTGSTPTNLGEAIFNNYIWVSKIAGFLFNLLTGNYGLWLALGIPVPYAILLSSATWLSYLITLIEIFK